MDKLPILKEEDFIITQDDLNLCLGSTELLPCPFCGDKYPMSSGRKTPNGRAVCWTIQCTRLEKSVPSCCASVWDTNRDQAVARQEAVKKWNRRPKS